MKRREPAKGGQGAGHILLLTFLGCARKVSRLAGRNPPVLTFSLELMDSEQSQGRGVTRRPDRNTVLHFRLRHMGKEDQK